MQNLITKPVKSGESGEHAGHGNSGAASCRYCGGSGKIEFIGPNGLKSMAMCRCSVGVSTLAAGNLIQK